MAAHLLQRLYAFLKWTLPILVAISLFALILWKIPKWQVPSACLSPKECFELENEARKTLAQILGGGLLLLGIYLTWRRIRASERQVEIAKEGQLTERFTRAVEQLGSDKLEIRLGGIYALERIARDSVKDHWPIMEILTAFVRENAALRATDTESEEEIATKEVPEHPPEKPAVDIQAVLTVLGRTAIPFAQKVEKRWLNLKATNLAGADLYDANLQRAQFWGANLQRAYMVGADLKKANLALADLHGAVIWGVNLQEGNLPSANLQKSNLWGANLKGAYLKKANLHGANLAEAKLQGANLTEARLLKANLQGADLRGAEGLTLEGVAEAIWDETTKWPEDFTPPARKEERPKENSTQFCPFKKRLTE
jgi:hypothetical protein